jgi:hypothetical protein
MMTVPAERRRKQARAAFDADMMDVLKNAQGRRVMWKIMADAGLMGRVTALDPYQAQRQLGRREVGLDLHDWVMRASPRAFLDMLETRAQEMEQVDDDDDNDTE